MDAVSLRQDLTESQNERAILLQEREQLEQQLEMTNTRIGHCEGGIIKLQKLVERINKEQEPVPAPKNEPSQPEFSTEYEASQGGD